VVTVNSESEQLQTQSQYNVYAIIKPKNKNKNILKGTNFNLIKDTGSTAESGYILPEFLMPLFQSDITKLTRGNALHLETDSDPKKHSLSKEAHRLSMSIPFSQISWVTSPLAALSESEVCLSGDIICRNQETDGIIIGITTPHNHYSLGV